MAQADSYFWMDGHLARSLQEVSDDPAALEDGNFWAVSLSFEGKALFARYSDLLASEFPEAPWQQLTGGWKSSQSEAEYLSYVSGIREAVAAGIISVAHVRTHNNKADVLTKPLGPHDHHNQLRDILFARQNCGV